MPVFKTPFNGYSVKFSPFYEHRFTVATSQKFSILGNGRLHISPTTTPSPTPISEIAYFDTADGIYDVAWYDSDDNLLVAAVADGSLKLYDLSLPPQQNPSRSLAEHTREVHSVDWNPAQRDSFISGSWDDTIKLWTIDRPTSVRTFKEHAYCVYSVSWNGIPATANNPTTAINTTLPAAIEPLPFQVKQLSPTLGDLHLSRHH